jgi:hypothetical protein
MATGIDILKPFEQGDRCVTEDGGGLIRRVIDLNGQFFCWVQLDEGGEHVYELETLAEADIDPNLTCQLVGLCDQPVVGERQHPEIGINFPTCSEHNHLAERLSWPGSLQPVAEQ